MYFIYLEKSDRTYSNGKSGKDEYWGSKCDSKDSGNDSKGYYQREESDYKGYEAKGVDHFEEPNNKYSRICRIADIINDDSILSAVDTIKKDVPKIQKTTTLSALNVKYDLVEPRSKSSVNMTVQMESKKRLREKRAQKPGLVAAVAEIECNRNGNTSHKFYGPQLPVQWAPDKKSLKKDKKAEKSKVTLEKAGEGSDSEDSVSKEIKQWLEAQHAGSSDPEREFTSAYLRSSHSGSLYRKKPAIVMHIPEDAERKWRRKLRESELQAEGGDIYLGPIDWTKEMLSNPVRMDVESGRDTKRVLKKGEHVVVPFNDPLDVIKEKGLFDIDPEPESAPYVLPSFGDHVRGGGLLAFRKQVAREDAVGPFGEKPASAAGDKVDQALLNEFLRNEGIDLASDGVLDVMREEAWDKVTRHGAIDNTGRLYSKVCG